MKNKQHNFEWLVMGFDTFEGKEYYIGSYFTRDEAFMVGREKLGEVRKTQPDHETGGQKDPNSVQDRVFVVSPAGEKYPISIEECRSN